MTAQKRLETFFGSKPGILQVFQRLNNNHVRWALFGGLQVALLTGIRESSDVDIVVHNDDFDKVAALFPEATRVDKSKKHITTSDGEEFDDVISKVQLVADGHEIELLAYTVCYGVDGTPYPTYYTPLAIVHTSHYSVGGVEVHMANPFDTIIIKAFLRRNSKEFGEFDLADAKALYTASPPDPEYVEQRTQEVGTTPGVEAFLKMVYATANQQNNKSKFRHKIKE